jgi:hypothetical protein
VSEYFYKLSNDDFENDILPAFLLFFTLQLAARDLNLGVPENERMKERRNDYGTHKI